MSTLSVGKRAYLEYRSKNIGYIAFEVLSQDQEASIIGVTSRGIFIHTSSRWVIFISFERYCSPLTITLAQAPGQLQFVEPGSPVQIQSGKLVLPSADIVICATREAVWPRSFALGTACLFSERLDCLRYFAREAIADRESLGLIALLPPLLDLAMSAALSPDQSLSLSNMSLLRRTLRTNISDATERICSFLGIGQGLTPSGDDFVMGLVLVLNRWRKVLAFLSDLEQLNLRVVEAAYRTTTTLSANLIECATFGESDERLLNVVDCIFTGQRRISECLSDLLGWGASSGADALVGMAVALTC